MSNRKKQQKSYVTDPAAYLEPRIDKEGYGSLPAKTVIEVFQESVQKHPNEPALCFKTPVNVSIKLLFCC